VEWKRAESGGYDCEMVDVLSGTLGWVAAALIGLSVGSFSNVAIYRLPLEGLSVWRPARSFCPRCRAKLAWSDNVPVLSWLLLRGRCRFCAAPISARYPLVELVVGALFVLLWMRVPPSSGTEAVRLLVYWYLAWACVVISAIDLEHLIIPDSITLPGIGLGVLLSLALPALHVGHAGFRPESPHGSSVVVSLLGMAAGGGSLWLVGKVGNVFFKRQVAEAGVEDAMGMGDVKWMAFAGTILGPGMVGMAILIGCFTGAVVGLVLRIGARLSSGEAPIGIPFGPFLSVGILVELLAPGAAWSVLQQIGSSA